MPGQWSLSRGVLFTWVLFALVTAPLIHPSQSHAGDEATADSGEMEKQREAYQSRYNLVKAVQKRLDVYGYRPGPIDGIFGPQTQTALIAFQKDNHLQADGAIGIETLRKLDLIRRSK